MEVLDKIQAKMLHYVIMIEVGYGTNRKDEEGILRRVPLVWL